MKLNLKSCMNAVWRAREVMLQWWHYRSTMDFDGIEQTRGARFGNIMFYNPHIILLCALLYFFLSTAPLSLLTNVSLATLYKMSYSFLFPYKYSWLFGGFASPVHLCTDCKHVKLWEPWVIIIVLMWWAY